MRRTLRRSCAACAKAKHSCDLRTPKCSRCVKRTCSCIYANEPLTSTNARLGGNYNETQTPQALKSRMGSASLNGLPASLRPDLLDMSTVFGARSFDPFDTYPSTNLPRLRVQGLIQHCECRPYGRFGLLLADLPQSCQKLRSNIIPWT